MESIEDLLAQVKAEYQQHEQAKQPKQQPLFSEAELKSLSSEPPTYQPQPQAQTRLSAGEESLLAQVKAEFEEQERAEELRRQQQLREQQLLEEQKRKEEQLREQHREKRKREALTQEAKDWLKQLDRRSEEGLWFEEFSYSYSSELEAAIDYLQALRETHR